MKYIKFASVALLSSLLVGCSLILPKSNGSTSDSETRVSQSENPQEVTTMTFYDYITETSKPVILYSGESNKFSFADKPKEIYVFSDEGNFIYWNDSIHGLTLGDLSEMTDKEIVDYLESKLPIDSKTSDLIGKFSDSNFYDKEKFMSVYGPSKRLSDTEIDVYYDDPGYFGTYKIKDSDKLYDYYELDKKGELISKKEIKSFDTGTRYMDDSGNTVLSRNYDFETKQVFGSITFDDLSDFTDDYSQDFPIERSYTKRLKYPFEGTIYDSTYKGLLDKDGDDYYVFRTNTDITIDTE